MRCIFGVGLMIFGTMVMIWCNRFMPETYTFGKLMYWNAGIVCFDAMIIVDTLSYIIQI